MTALVAVRVIAALAIAYLLGGIPWALIIGMRFYDVDPRLHGSGNLGATNVFRVLGARAAIATLLLDAGKGALAVWLAMVIVPSSAHLVWEWTRVLAMMAAVLGHSYSPYIRLKGGKGVATSAGALAVLMPLATLIAVLVFIGVVTVSRMVSLGSIVVALVIPALLLRLYPGDLPLTIVTFGLAALVLWRHRSNMVRIVRGQENRVSFRARGDETRRKGGE